MKICLISDTHGFHRSVTIPECDVLIHAGDFMRTGNIVGEIIDFNSWLGSLPCKHIIVVAGNHDIMLEKHPAMKSVLSDAVYLQDTSCMVDGVTFYGSPWTPKFMDWAFMKDRGSQIRRYWDMIPSYTDVLITHGPPANVLDKLPSFTEPLGCADLRDAVQRVNPRLHVFGHIHFGRGEEIFPLSPDGEPIHFVNAAICDDAYRPVNDPIVVELN